MDLPDWRIAWRFDITVVSTVDFADQQFEDRDERDQKVLVEVHEHVLPSYVGIGLLALELSWDDLHHLHEGLLRAEHVGYVENGLLRHTDDDETVLRQLFDFSEVDLADVFIEVANHIVDVIVIRDIFTPLEQVSLLLALLILLPKGTDQIDQPLALEPSVLNLFLGLNFNIKAIVSQDLPSDDISSPEKIASLRSKLISLLGNELPEALIADSLIRRIFKFLEIVLLLC